MSPSSIIAALYVDPRGPYPNLADVECWDAARDARTYAGPHPVVAHPPCGPWSFLWRLSKNQDADCAPIAIGQVRRWGGVVEHPLGSRIWRELPVADGLPDEYGGYTIDVEQVSWGHVARKRTRLYFVGVPRVLVAATVRTGGTPTHWVAGGRIQRHGGGCRPLDIKACSAQQRRRTPPAFAEWLVMLARASIAA